MGIVTMIAGLILSLSILVVLHEMGHFIPAKLFKTRVEKFYLFFDPYFSLFKKTIGETEYGIGWLPLGGYVKISGMIDESMDTEQMKEEPQPWEFRSKPAWQRLVIMLGGVTVNFILGGFIFAMLFFAYGEKYLPTENLKYGIVVDSLGYDMGLRDGDVVLAVDTVQLKKFSSSKVTKEIVLNNANNLTVQRDEKEVRVPIDPKFVNLLSSYDYKNYYLFAPRLHFIIKNVPKTSPNANSGLQANDRVISVNGTPTLYHQEAYKLINSAIDKTLQLGVERNGSQITIQVKTNAKGKIGVDLKTHMDQFEIERQAYTFYQSLPAGFSKGYNFLADQIKAFGQMFRGKIKASDSLGGFGTITNLFPKTWDWEVFWNITAMLSLILGFMNLLPIPALDGGHVMFLIYEVITGKTPSDKFMEYATLTGFVIVIALLLYANGLDVWRWLKG
jgi:regulator of sigma E protease